MKIFVKGAGVAGLTVAWELVSRGAKVSVAEIHDHIGNNSSWYAGGMLAPCCERESAEEPVMILGRAAVDWWDATLPGQVSRNGSLVVAPARDTTEIDRFAARTIGHESVDAQGIAALEPDLAERFRRGLYFAAEGHLDPRLAMSTLQTMLEQKGVTFMFGCDASFAPAGMDVEIDCTGVAAGLPGLRGVRGEMLVLETPEISLSRPVRLLHPRGPAYVVPRSGNCFMLGATMIETQAAGPISVRSTMELLNAAYTLHPAFGEAEIIETGVGIRPAFADNLPRIERSGRNLRINGLYRHGFLLAPVMARQAADMIFGSQRQEATP